jgi:hypothetical protein
MVWTWVEGPQTSQKCRSQLRNLSVPEGYMQQVANCRPITPQSPVSLPVFWCFPLGACELIYIFATRQNLVVQDLCTSTSTHLNSGNSEKWRGRIDVNQIPYRRKVAPYTSITMPWGVLYLWPNTSVITVKKYGVSLNHTSNHVHLHSFVFKLFLSL